MTAISQAIHTLQGSLPKGVDLVAVSKFHPVEALMEAYNAGQRIFGESRAQELIKKVPEMPDDVEWHFIGHLQTNKVKSIIPIVSLIHSIDSEKLLRTVDEEAGKAGRIVDVLLELHVAQEESKFGFTTEDSLRLAGDGTFASLKNVRIRGVMGMATNTEDEAEIAKEFHAIRAVFDTLKQGAMSANPEFSIVSMGMSDDYEIAIAEGSTMVRVGSKIFGPRQY